MRLHSLRHRILLACIGGALLVMASVIAQGIPHTSLLAFVFSSPDNGSSGSSPLAADSISPSAVLAPRPPCASTVAIDLSPMVRGPKAVEAARP